MFNVIRLKTNLTFLSIINSEGQNISKYFILDFFTLPNRIEGNSVFRFFF